MHNITGLIPGTTYNLSLLASNSLGTGPGHVQVVTTMKGQAICMYVNVYSVTCNEIYTGYNTCTIRTFYIDLDIFRAKVR